MPRVTIRPTAFTRQAINNLKKSSQIASKLRPIAQAVMDAAKSDPNDEYVKSLRMSMYTTDGEDGRVSWQVGAAPIIGSRVEAKRGTLQRALGQAGL